MHQSSWRWLWLSLVYSFILRGAVIALRVGWLFRETGVARIARGLGGFPLVERAAEAVAKVGMACSQMVPFGMVGPEIKQPRRRVQLFNILPLARTQRTLEDDPGAHGLGNTAPELGDAGDLRRERIERRRADVGTVVGAEISVTEIVSEDEDYVRLRVNSVQRGQRR